MRQHDSFPSLAVWPTSTLSATSLTTIMSRKASNTLSAQHNDLETFSHFLSLVHDGAYALNGRHLQEELAVKVYCKLVGKRPGTSTSAGLWRV